MANKLSSSWSLIKSSAKVLNADKELMVFPILSGISMILLTAVFFVPMLLIGYFGQVANDGLQIADYIILFLFYLIQYLAIFFSNTALVGAALIRIRGGDPTVRDGLKIAFSRFMPIFLYALIAATVGMILSLIRNRGNSITRTLASIGGFVWNVATFLVVPILAVENVGPIEAIKRSVAYLKKTWGEQLIGNFGIGTVFGLLFFIFIVVAGLLVFLLVSINAQAWAYIALAAVSLIFILGLSLVHSTLNGIYTAAVYQFAVSGEAGTFFDPQTVSGAFVSTGVKKSIF